MIFSDDTKIAYLPKLRIKTGMFPRNHLKSRLLYVSISAADSGGGGGGVSGFGGRCCEPLGKSFGILGNGFRRGGIVRR